MDMVKAKKLAFGLAVAYAAYRFGGKEVIKAAALGVMGTIVARQLPIVSDAITA